MTIILNPSDELIIRFSETDGEFRIHFDSKKYKNKIAVEETGYQSDDEGRKGLLYEECFHENI